MRPIFFVKESILAVGYGNTVAWPTQAQQRRVELGVHLSRRARRLLGNTGAVHKNVPNLEVAATQAAKKLWNLAKISKWWFGWTTGTARGLVPTQGKQICQ